MRFGDRRGGSGGSSGGFRGGRDGGRDGGHGGGGFRGGGDYGGPQREAPVKVGEEYDVQITDIAAKGDGIAKVEGFIIFIAGASKGDTCKIRIKEVARRFAVGEKIGAGSAPAAEAASEEPAEESEEDEGEEQTA